MGQIVSTTLIDAEPDAVWARLNDIRRVPEWVEFTERMIEVPDGEMGAGSVYTEYGGVKPFLAESEWHVTAFEPMRRQVHVGDDGTMRMDLEMELDAGDDGTRLTMTFGMRPRWYAVPVNTVLWPLMMRRRSLGLMDQTLANLKRDLESGN